MRLVGKFILTCCFFATWLATPAAAQNAADSLRALLPSLEGQAKIDTYYRLAAEYRNAQDLDAEVTCYGGWLRYARSQNNVEWEDLARENRSAAYKNNNLENPFYGEDMEFWHKNGLWDSYFHSDNWRLQTICLNGDPDKALAEARKQYDFAKEHNLNIGIGIVSHSMGYAYMQMGQYEDALPHFREAAGRLKKEKPSPLLLEVYYYLSQILAATGRASEIPPMLKEWKAQLEKDYPEEEAAHAAGWQNYYIQAAIAYSYLSQFETAEKYLHQAEKFAGIGGNTPIARYAVLCVWSEYYKLKGDYPNALQTLDSIAALNIGNGASSLIMLQEKAELAGKAGMHELEAQTYKELYHLADSVQKVQMVAQLDELRTVYEVDRHILEKERNRNYFIFAAIACILVLSGWIFHSRQMTRKNRGLYRQIREQDRLAEELGQMRQRYEASAPPVSAGNDNADEQRVQLAARLREYLLTNKRFANPDMDMAELITALGTNRTYLFEAMKAVTNQTPQDYINALRLEEAKRLLDTSDELIESIAVMSGYNTSRTFYRLFRERYNISPAEYRKMAREKP